MHYPHQAISYSRKEIFGAERNPNGSTVSTYTYRVFFHCMPRRGRSPGWTGTILYASLRSSFASWVPAPSWLMIWAAMSTEVYLMDHCALSRPAFTLCPPPPGDDKSTMWCNLSGWLRLGMTLMGLTCKSGTFSPSVVGIRTTRRSWTSCSR